MKLGEALTERADIIRRIQEVDGRIVANAVTQEGESPAEDPKDLLEQAERLADRLEAIIAAINLTNSQTHLADGRSITVALARRDVLGTRTRTLASAIRAAQASSSRYSLTEIRNVRHLDVPQLQAAHDQLARERRELDTQIQAHNWTTELLEG